MSRDTGTYEVFASWKIQLQRGGIKSDQPSTWKWIRVQLKRLEQFANAIAFVIYRTIINDRVVNRVYLIASAGSARARVCAQIYQNVGEHSHPIKGSSNDRPPRPAHSFTVMSRHEIFPTRFTFPVIHWAEIARVRSGVLILLKQNFENCQVFRLLISSLGTRRTQFWESKIYSIIETVLWINVRYSCAILNVPRMGICPIVN